MGSGGTSTLKPRDRYPRHLFVLVVARSLAAVNTKLHIHLTKPLLSILPNSFKDLILADSTSKRLFFWLLTRPSSSGKINHAHTPAVMSSSDDAPGYPFVDVESRG